MNIFRRIFKFFKIKEEKCPSDLYVNYLTKLGVKIGKNTVFYNPHTTSIDVTRPWLIEIGDNVKITSGVIVLTHDYAWSVLRNKYNGQILPAVSKVKIGNNVFIGVNSIILKGVTIGNNVIIGAGSLVIDNIPDDVIFAGNPAKKIMSLHDYYLKRKAAYLNEMDEMVLEYYKKYKKAPPLDIFREHFLEFTSRDITPNKLNNSFKFKFDKQDDSLTYQFFLNSNPNFKDFQDYINYINSKYGINLNN
jgi:acetyltransferase-like isoleucine patch superfamily enzyme